MGIDAFKPQTIRTIHISKGWVKDGSSIEVWNLDTPAAAPKVLAGHPNVVTALAFSPDGTQLASQGLL